MFDIKLYEDERGYSDVKAFIKELREKSTTSKDARINFNKVVAYIDILEEMGTPFSKENTEDTGGRDREGKAGAGRL